MELRQATLRLLTVNLHPTRQYIALAAQAETQKSAGGDPSTPL